MSKCITPISACIDVPTIADNKTVGADDLNTGDVVAIPGEPTEPGEAADSFPAVVRQVSAQEAGGHIVYVHYLEDSFEYYEHKMAAGDVIFRISAAVQ
ncbi:hypothetical protein [Nonomuraea sp. NPDC052265]|uniref:hypothetical protein n=1 Tax=Nonomuraea sp. NPDC052265 TaxID=3364374 RepID=UPI0037C567BE